MNFKNWRTWMLMAAAIIALFTIYSFASPNSPLRPRSAEAQVASTERPVRRTVANDPARVAPVGGLEPICMECLDPASGTYRSDRNLFAFVEPPPPPPPGPPPPPSDRDKDGVPDFQDNCPDIANPDQMDVDRNGVGTVCQQGVEAVPPPIPPPLPEFTYKYLGSFGTASRPIAAFSAGDQIVNVRVGETFGGRFILKKIGIESVDIGYVGWPPDQVTRIPVGQ